MNYGGVKRIFQEQKSASKEKEFVSLGDHCVVALYLKKFGFKKCSYPFDWIISNVDMLTHILLDNFETFINDPGFYDQYVEGKIFHHHSMTTNKDYFQRCIARFRNLASTAHVVFFLAISRTGGDTNTDLKQNHREYSTNDFTKLVDILQQEYSIQNCRLVVLNLLPNEPKTTFVKKGDSIDIHNIRVNLWRAILDEQSANTLKDIFESYLK